MCPRVVCNSFQALARVRLRLDTPPLLPPRGRLGHTHTPLFIGGVSCVSPGGVQVKNVICDRRELAAYLLEQDREIYDWLREMAKAFGKENLEVVAYVRRSPQEPQEAPGGEGGQ